MERKRQPEGNDEPAVTFELEETPHSQDRRKLGAAGAAAAAGAGLMASGAMREPLDSLDVFDLPAEPTRQSGDVPVTSFRELDTSPDDPDFPPIDFAESSPVDAGDLDTNFGASSDVGGGFVLDDGGGADTFGASEAEMNPVPDSLLDDDYIEDDADIESGEPEDIDLT